MSRAEQQPLLRRVLIGAAAAANILGISQNQVALLRRENKLTDYKAPVAGQRKHFSQYDLNEVQSLLARFGGDSDALMRSITGRSAHKSNGNGDSPIVGLLMRIEERLTEIERRLQVVEQNTGRAN
jgi:hypothetical protein